MGYTPPHLNVRKISGGYSVSPDGVTTDDLTIYPNPIDTTPYIKLNGTTSVDVESSYYLNLYNGALNFGRFTIDGTTGLIITAPVLNGDIKLVTSGTGLLKYGVKTAHADQAIDGYITFKLADGTTAYLACLTPV